LFAFMNCAKQGRLSMNFDFSSSQTVSYRGSSEAASSSVAFAGLCLPHLSMALSELASGPECPELTGRDRKHAWLGCKAGQSGSENSRPHCAGASISNEHVFVVLKVVVVCPR